VNEYFSDGLTEELINVLTCVPGLRVVARTSVYCFKHVVLDMRESGGQRNVQTVLEGRVGKSGDQTRVTAKLVDVSTGYHLVFRRCLRKLERVSSARGTRRGSGGRDHARESGPNRAHVVRNQTTNLAACLPIGMASLGKHTPASE
jgi:hypothetical protein